MTSKLLFKIWAPLLLAFAAIACGGPSTTSNGGGDPVVPEKPADVAVAETLVDFGFGECGGAAGAQKTIKIENKGGGTVSWTAEIELPTFAVVGATSGTFTGGGSANIVVRPVPIAASAAAGTELRGTLVVIIDKQKFFRVPLRVVAQGATLTVLPNDAAFGEAPLNVQAPNIPLTIKNTGNKEVTVSLGVPPASDFEVAGGGVEVKVAPGATLPNAAARFRPTKLTQQSTTAAITVKGPVCGASANAVAMSGKGTGGVVGVSPGQLDFGKVNCGTKGFVKAFTISNLGNSAFDWTATLTDGTYFDLSLSTGTILAQNQAQVTVTPKDIPATSAISDNLYGDSITITTTVPNSDPIVVPLLMTAQGAILAFTTVPNDYGVRGLFGAVSGKTVTVTNTGNAAANVKLTSTTAAYVASPETIGVVGGGANSSTVNFAPVVFGDNNADLSMSTASVICQPLPGAIALTGKGKGIASNVAVGFERNPQEAGSACAVLTGGHIACWGDNRYGQLGDGTTTAQPTPIVIPNFPPAPVATNAAVQVASGGGHNCARTVGGNVYCWGSNTTPNQGTVGQLGSAGGNKSTPTLVAGLANVTSLGADHHRTCAVSGGKVFCWGTNRRGQLGNGTPGTPASTTTPIQVSGITDATSIDVGTFGGCARRATGGLQCWGVNNTHGQLGNGTTTGNPTGAAVAATPTNVVAANGIAVGGQRASGGAVGCVAQVGGAVMCWGDNKYPQGRFGAGTNGKITFLANTSSNAQAPIAIAGVAGATAVAVGQRHMCAVVGGGAVQCWGGGSLGELGNGASPAVSAPVSVTGVAGATQISAAGSSTCAVLGTGEVKCWGANDAGQLGNAAGGSTPTLVTGF